MPNLQEAYTWQAVYETIPLNLDKYKNSVPNLVYAGDLTGEVLSDLWEIDEKGVQVATYKDIDRVNIKCFNVYKTVEAVEYLKNYKKKPIMAKPFMAVELLPGYRLIWRKRRRQRVFNEGGVFLTIYMVGWQETITGVVHLPTRKDAFTQNSQAINYIYHYTAHGFDTSKDVVVLSSGGKSDVELFDFELPTAGKEGGEGICQNMSISHYS